MIQSFSAEIIIIIANVLVLAANRPLKRTSSRTQNVRLSFNWRASVASETLTGVTQSKIGDVCLFI